MYSNLFGAGAYVGKVVKTGVKKDTRIVNAMAIVDELKKLYASQGIPAQVVDWLVIRDYMESGAFTNTGAKLNNPGNIMWPKKGKLPYGQKGPYNAVNKTYYTYFPGGLPEYVKQAKLVIQQAPGRPIDATSAMDFVKRLKANNYFGNETVENYYNAMKGAAGRINLASKYNTESTEIIVPEDQQPSALDNIPTWAKWGGGILLGTVLLNRLLK